LDKRQIEILEKIESKYVIKKCNICKKKVRMHKADCYCSQACRTRAQELARRNNGIFY